MKKTIAVMASLDTKGRRSAFIKEMIERLGCRALIIDVGVLGEPALTPGCAARGVVAAAAAGIGRPLPGRQKHENIAAMSEGAPVLAADLYRRGAFDAILSIGGVQNTTIAVAAMKALPIGVPKLMVSTVASGQTYLRALCRQQGHRADASGGGHRGNQRADPHDSGERGCRRRRDGCRTADSRFAPAMN